MENFLKLKKMEPKFDQLPDELLIKIFSSITSGKLFSKFLKIPKLRPLCLDFWVIRDIQLKYNTLKYLDKNILKKLIYENNYLSKTLNLDKTTNPKLVNVLIKEFDFTIVNYGRNILLSSDKFNLLYSDKNIFVYKLLLCFSYYKSTFKDHEKIISMLNQDEELVRYTIPFFTNKWEHLSKIVINDNSYYLGKEPIFNQKFEYLEPFLSNSQFKLVSEWILEVLSIDQFPIFDIETYQRTLYVTLYLIGKTKLCRRYYQAIICIGFFLVPTLTRYYKEELNFFSQLVNLTNNTYTVFQLYDIMKICLVEYPPIFVKFDKIYTKEELLNNHMIFSIVN